MHFASAPSYSTLLTGLDPAQTGKIESTLSAKGIGYQIQNGGTALAVDSSQTSQARIALASAGLLGVGSTAARLRAAQQLAARRLELPAAGHLPARARGSARPDDRADPGHRLRHREPRPSQPAGPAVRRQQPELERLGAAVRLRQPRPERGQGHRRAGRLERPGPVRPEGHDHRLERGAAVAGLGRERRRRRPTSQQAADQQYDSTTAAAATALLAQTLGPGKAQVVVNANVNANQATSDTLTYGKKGVPLTRRRRPRRSRAAAPPPRARPARSRPTPRPPAAATPTTRTRPPTRPTASTRPSPTR